MTANGRYTSTTMRQHPTTRGSWGWARRRLSQRAGVQRRDDRFNHVSLGLSDQASGNRDAKDRVQPAPQHPVRSERVGQDDDSPRARNGDRMCTGRVAHGYGSGELRGVIPGQRLPGAARAAYIPGSTVGMTGASNSTVVPFFIGQTSVRISSRCLRESENRGWSPDRIV